MQVSEGAMQKTKTKTKRLWVQIGAIQTHYTQSDGAVPGKMDRSSLSSRRIHSLVRGQLHATTKRISAESRDALYDVISYIPSFITST